MEDPAEELERLKRAGDPPTLTQAILDAISDDDLEHEIFCHILKKKIGKATDRTLEIVRGLSPGLRMLYSTWLVAMEVPNGGFNQFFWNHDPRFAFLAREGFQLIGAEKLARLMDRVIRVRALEAEDIRPFLEAGTVEAFSESYKHTALSDLDPEFYALDDEGRALRLQYIRKHPQEFTGP